MPDTAPLSVQVWPRAAWVAGGVAALLIGGTLALWAHYGSAVFFEIIAAGIAACF
jgi:hypothetical protein